MERPESCSVLSLAAGEPLAGTAPQARIWIAWEYAGPWGRRALESQRLNPQVRQGLVALSEVPGVSVLLVRRPPMVTGLAGPVVLLAHAAGTPPTAFVAPQPEPAVIASWADELGVGRLPECVGRRAMAEPALLVCGHSSRDACCAIEGRRLLSQLHARGVPAWESSHLGGHRFAPTALLLPDGLIVGRVSADSARTLIADGMVDLETWRGRSTSSPAGQVAELAVRREINERRLEMLDVDDEGNGSVRITHRDGRQWLVHVESRRGPTARPESCGGGSHLPAVVDCTSLAAVPDLG